MQAERFHRDVLQSIAETVNTRIGDFRLLAVTDAFFTESVEVDASGCKNAW